MKVVGLPRGAGKTEVMVRALIDDPDAIVLTTTMLEAQMIVDRAMEEAKAPPAELSLWQKRVHEVSQAMSLPLPQHARLYIDNVDYVLSRLFAATVHTVTFNLYDTPHDDDEDHPYDWSTEAAVDQPDAWKVHPDPTMDRMWMMEDTLNRRDYDDSMSITAEFVKEMAAAGNLRFVEQGRGNLISSMVGPDQHRPILDLDGDHHYVPSSQPGHGHLYINNVVLNDLEHYLLISTLVQLGILGKGSKAQLEAVGMSLTRPRNIKKHIWQRFMSTDDYASLQAHKDCPKCKHQAATASLPPNKERF